MNFWKTVYRTACVVFVLLIVALAARLFLPKIRQVRRDERRIAELDAAIRQTEEDIRELQSRRQRFQNDPAFVERIARESLGKARPGDTIYRFTDRPPHQQP